MLGISGLSAMMTFAVMTAVAVAKFIGMVDKAGLFRRYTRSYESLAALRSSTLPLVLVGFLHNEECHGFGSGLSSFFTGLSGERQCWVGIHWL